MTVTVTGMTLESITPVLGAGPRPGGLGKPTQDGRDRVNTRRRRKTAGEELLLPLIGRHRVWVRVPTSCVTLGSYFTCLCLHFPV